MSASNSEAVDRAFEAFARADRSGWDELIHPEVEVIPVGDWPEAEIRGRDAVWKFLVAADEPWEPGRYELSEAVEDADHAVIRMRRNLKGRSSGIQLDYDYWIGCTFADEQLTRIEWFPTRDEAVSATGVSES
jgi:ketosteroid isomerase-like protein